MIFPSAMGTITVVPPPPAAVVEPVSTSPETLNSNSPPSADPPRLPWAAVAADVSTHHLPVMSAARTVTVIHRMAKSARMDVFITVMMTAGTPGVTHALNRGIRDSSCARSVRVRQEKTVWSEAEAGCCWRRKGVRGSGGKHVAPPQHAVTGSGAALCRKRRYQQSPIWVTIQVSRSFAGHRHGSVSDGAAWGFRRS
jgi:hypothetical protein